VAEGKQYRASSQQLLCNKSTGDITSNKKYAGGSVAHGRVSYVGQYAGDCELLRKQRQVLRNSFTKAGGNWPITNTDLANKYTKFFQKFVKNINFEDL
jgi:hypothetical protein